MKKTDFTPLAQELGITIINEAFFHEAFTHKSYLNENRGIGRECNERLEFLGDAVLEYLATKFLFDEFPEHDEGILTAYRSALVRGENLAKIGKKLDLGTYLYISKGEEKSGGREKDYLLANVFEALLGAVFLDSGVENAKKILENLLFPQIEQIIEESAHKDPKSLFQEIAQEKRSITPHFEVLSESGPDHSKKFIVGAFLNQECVGQGAGSSKQRASTEAALNALKHLAWM